jgi:hypothetical protein
MKMSSRPKDILPPINMANILPIHHLLISSRLRLQVAVEGGPTQAILPTSPRLLLRTGFRMLMMIVTIKMEMAMT